MSQAREIDELRSAFESGDFEQALELLTTLPQQQRLVGIRLYLLHRPGIFAAIRDWCRAVRTSETFFLDAEVLSSGVPQLILECRSLEIDVKQCIEDELLTNPGRFTECAIDYDDTNAAVVRLDQERAMRGSLIFRDEAALREAEERVVDLVKRVIKRDGGVLNALSRSEIHERGRQWLTTRPDVQQWINRSLQCERDFQREVDDLVK